MDEIDLQLALLLLKNSRMPYRKLAEEVELSVNAVHSRIKNLIDSGMIKEFTAQLSYRALEGCVIMSVDGMSENNNSEDLISTIGEDERTFRVAAASGNFLYVQAILRDFKKMNDFVEKISEKAEIKKPEIFIVDMSEVGKLKDFEFSKTDYKIIHSLQHDARKSLSDVAKELNLSAKTVRRRLDEMKGKGAVTFTLKHKPTYTSDIISFFDYYVVSGYDRKKVRQRILDEFSPNLYGISIPVNHPNMMRSNCWTKNLNQVHEIKRKLREKDYIESVDSRLYYNSKDFDTWRDDLLESKV